MWSFRHNRESTTLFHFVSVTDDIQLRIQILSPVLFEKYPSKYPMGFSSHRVMDDSSELV